MRSLWISLCEHIVIACTRPRRLRLLDINKKKIKSYDTIYAKQFFFGHSHIHSTLFFWSTKHGNMQTNFLFRAFSHSHLLRSSTYGERERESKKNHMQRQTWHINQQITQIRVEEKRRIDFSLFLQQTAKFHWSENERHLLWMVPSRNETCKSIGCMVFAMLTTKIYVAMDHSHTCFRFITWA